MTISELERFVHQAIEAKSKGFASDETTAFERVVLDLIADWRAMREMLRRVSSDCACTEHSQWTSNVLDNLKAKP